MKNWEKCIAVEEVQYRFLKIKDDNLDCPWAEEGIDFHWYTSKKDCKKCKSVQLKNKE
jgi:uncharacterized protein (UPF0179 family)